MVKFSIVIPVYNAENTVKRSVLSCINQSYSNFEIIIVDDCSTDHSLKIIHETFDDPRIRLISLRENVGVAKTRNIGWDQSVGEYVVFLDSDDSWHEHKLQVINEVLNKGNIKCLGHLYTDNPRLLNIPSTISERNLGFWNFLFKNYFNTSCLTVKSDIDFRFNEEMRYTEDHELLVRISNVYPVVFLNAYLTLLGRPQLSQGGLSGNKKKMRLGEIKMYFSAARCNRKVTLILPFLVFFSCVKHLMKIFR